jgi:hypothetical protein
MRLLAVVLIALVAAPAAQAKRVKNLWATVNVCDTKRSPNDVGLRARAPGDGTRAQIYMRFTTQYRSGDTWKRVDGGRSKWLRAGTSLRRYQEIGYTFSFNAPPAGKSYLTRGFVQYQWRDHRKHHRHRVVVRRAERYTEAGHPTQESEPKRFSAARCTIATPPKSTGALPRRGGSSASLAP